MYNQAMNPYDEYCRLLDEVLGHDCGQYVIGMCADCRATYNKAQELEKEFGDSPIWEQRSLMLPA